MIGATTTPAARGGTVPVAVLGQVLVIAAVLGFGWKLYQLARAPRSLPLRVVTAFLGLLLVAILSTVYPAESAALFGAGGAVLVQNLCALTFSFLIVSFFIGTDATVDRRRRSRSILRELAIMVVAAAVMGVALFDLPPDAHAELHYGGPMTPPAAWFFGVGNAYLAYAGLQSARRAIGYARRTDRRTALGLRITATAQLVGALAGVGRIVSVLVRASGHPFPAEIDAVFTRVLLTTLIVFFVGLSFPGLATRYQAIRRRRFHRRMYPRLVTLWTLLATTFPEGTLARSQMGDAWWRVRSVDLRCYRRAVECRDGLVRVSPFLAHRGVADGSTDVDAVAAALTQALADYREGLVVDPTAVRILPPASDRLDDDILVLAALSAALSRIDETAGIAQGTR